MKIIKNKAFRFFIFLLGFAGILTAIICVFSEAFRLSYNSSLDKVPYVETEYVKERVADTAQSLIDNAAYKKIYDEQNIGQRKLNIKNYDDGKKETITIDEITDDTDLKQTFLMQEFNKQSSYYSYSLYDLNNINMKSVDSFIKIKLNDYLNIIKEKGYKYDDSYLGYYDEEEIIPEEETSPGLDDSQAKNDLSDNDRNDTDREALEKIYNKLSRFCDKNENVNLDEISYFIYEDDSFLIYSENCHYIFRSGIFTPIGHQNLEAVNDEYVYVADSEKELNNEQLDDHILKSEMYCSKMEVMYVSLSEKEREAISDSLHELNMYDLGGNDTAIYSFDGKEVAGGMKSVDYHLEQISKSDDSSAKSYDELKKELSDSSDIYIEYDAKRQKLVQWNKDESENKRDFDYINNINDKGIEQTLKEANISFVYGAKIYNTRSWASVEQKLFETAGKVPFAGLLAVIGIIIFLAAVVILTISEGRELIWFDKIPYFFQATILCIFITIVGVCISVLSETRSLAIDLFTNEMTAIAAGIILVCFIVYILCAAIYLSMIRRIKAKRFLDGFISVKVFRWLKKIVLTISRKISGKTGLIIFLVAYLVMNFIVSLGIISGAYPGSFAGTFVLLLLLAALNIGFILYMIKYYTDMQELLKVTRCIEDGNLDAKVQSDKLSFNVRELGDSINNLGDGLAKAIEDSVREERTKAELITNVSHDIKTPLTSIINYVGLLKNEEISNQKAVEYIDVIDKKSERLKQLIMDLIEASKTSTGNIELEKMNLNLIELLGQAVGEYEDKFGEKSLDIVKTYETENAVIYADGRRIFRIIDNVLGNVYKYAMPGTRVYMDLKIKEDSVNNNDSLNASTTDLAENNTNVSRYVELSIKNISKEMLNISPEELTERFVRGDKSRSTEGSGLGLSIARNLTELHDGTFNVDIKGDLFEVKMAFPMITE